MINQPTLFQLYRQMTGSTMYVPKALSAASLERWQRARIQEYTFQGIEVE